VTQQAVNRELKLVITDTSREDRPGIVTLLPTPLLLESLSRLVGRAGGGLYCL
jgi:hypothetical protein